MTKGLQVFTSNFCSIKRVAVTETTEWVCSYWWYTTAGRSTVPLSSLTPQSQRAVHHSSTAVFTWPTNPGSIEWWNFYWLGV